MSEYAQLQRSLARGWNTWHTRSVMTHVLLPHGLAIQLGIKEYRNGRYLREALVGRRGRGVETVRPGIRSYDGTYTELTLIWEDMEFRVESAAEGEDLVLLVTPIRGQLLPAVLIAECGILWNREGYVRPAPDRNAVEAVLPDGTVTIYPTSSPVEEYHVSAPGPYLAQKLDAAVGLSTGKRRTVEEIASILSRNRKLVEQQAEKYNDLSDLYTAMKTCLAWDTIYDPGAKRVITTASRIWNDQGYKLFCWDSYFDAYMFMADHRELAYANAVEITRSSRSLGFVPNFEWSGSYFSRDRSHPPVGSFIVLQLYRKYGEKWLLEEVFDQLYTWNAWWPEQRQVRESLLAYGSNPIKPHFGNIWETDGVHDTYGAALESGLDNSPMYDDIPFNRKKNVVELADAGLMGLYVMDCLALAEMADILGDANRSAALRKRAETFGAGLGRLWNDQMGMFCNWRTDTEMFGERLSPTNFFPLLTPFVTEHQVNRMVSEHLLNPKEFWGEWVLPSIARNDPAYPDQNYWRGRVWAPLNLLVYLGLRKQGRLEEASQLAGKSAALLRKEWRERGHVHENYNADTGEGCDVENSDCFYHFGSLLAFIALMDRGYVPVP